MKKLFLIWLFSGSLDSFCQTDTAFLIRTPIDPKRLGWPVVLPVDTVATKPDTLRATLMVTYGTGRRVRCIPFTKPGFVVKVDDQVISYLDDRKIIIKAPAEVWGYKVRNDARP